MKKIVILLLVWSFSFSLVSKADEGMWLPVLLKKYNYDQMKKMGLKLKPEQIYEVNKSSLKDAIAWFNGGCTSEIISDQGLLLTNHHCGYGAIQSHSTVSNNILKNGFWARSTKEELPNPGMWVSILVRMEDVTAEVQAALQGIPAEKQADKLAEISKAITKKATDGTHYEAMVRDMFKGNEYYLFVFEKFTDIRLVGTPPEAIGKFGGDTDNWMWPRHTGDFSMFRIYAGKDNKPAPYSPDNVPYKPRHFLPVNIKGIKDGDFAMVYGFPGRTNRYETSFGIKLAIDESNPAIVKLRSKRLELMKEQMSADPAVRIQLASRYAQIANYWKYFIGQTEQLKRLKVYDKKVQEEQAFQQWATDKSEYAGILEKTRMAYAAYQPYNLHGIYLREGVQTPILIQMANAWTAYMKAGKDTAAQRKALDGIKSGQEALLKLYNPASDEKILAATLHMFYHDIPKNQHPAMLSEIFRTGSYDEAAAYAAMVFRSSLFCNKDKANALLNAPDSNVVKEDVAFMYAKAFNDNYNNNFSKYAKEFGTVLSAEGKTYMKALREMNSQRIFYPDANSTLRLTYGQVKSYRPKDGMLYDYKTTLGGVVEKDQPGNDEFDVPARIKELYASKDFGRYAENGDVPVAFISTNDITGGNSGSPVINAKGQLIGLAFDGNWEAMSGDIAFDSNYKRTISVDIRYVLFIIDKFAGAQNLISEMKIIE